MTDQGLIKKLLNDPSSAVDEMLESILNAHVDLLSAAGNRAVARAVPAPSGKVGIALGGGSGHEPAFLGYVGPGLADSAAVGNVFAAPSPDSIVASIEAADLGAGVILLYGNYSGDVLNCRLAIRSATARGLDVRSVFVADDVASASADQRDRRRGIAGEVLVFKAAGAAADSGRCLDEVERIARKANDAIGSMGVALSGAELPGARRPVFESPAGQMEVGLGVHGEPGVRRAPLGTADQVGQMLVETIVPDIGIAAGDDVVVLVNGLGATTAMEQHLVHRAATAALTALGVTIHRSYVGEYVTSLQMSGLSVTLMKLDDELRDLIDRPAHSLGWRA